VKEFRLGGRRIVAENGRCTDAAGTLAGSDLDMASAVRNAEAMMDVDFATAVRMASASPARAIGLAGRYGSIEAGAKADLVLMSAEKKVVETWIGGRAARA
jgi:N-acetylglucosamine-6-phosphate deacetylase